jgi:nicotinamide riboside kinase
MKIAILGAQGSGKTQLAHDLSCRLRSLHDVTSVIADTPPLMAAVYGDLLHDNQTLYESAFAHHKTYDLTLVSGLDIPCSGGRPHDAGSVSRELVDAQLRVALTRGRIAYTVIYGWGPARVDAALNAIAPLRHDRAIATNTSHWQWTCDKCSDAACEHQIFTGRLKIGAA